MTVGVVPTLVYWPSQSYGGFEWPAPAKSTCSTHPGQLLMIVPYTGSWSAVRMRASLKMSFTTTPAAAWICAKHPLTLQTAASAGAVAVASATKTAEEAKAWRRFMAAPHQSHVEAAPDRVMVHAA